MQSHLNEDRCLDLIRGFLSPEERERILAHMQACAECETLFVRHLADEERLRARGALRATPDGRLKLEPYLTEEPATAPDSRRQSLRRFLRPALGVASTAAAVVVLLLLSPRQAGDDPAAMLRPMPALGEQVRLRSDPPYGQDEAFALGVDAYERGDLHTAVKRLERATTTGGPGRLEALRRIYLGSAYARLGQFDEAAQVLETVPFVSVPDPWGGEGRWTLYVAYKSLQRDALAQAILEELSREPGQFGDRARDALNRH